MTETHARLRSDKWTSAVMEWFLNSPPVVARLGGDRVFALRPTLPAELLAALAVQAAAPYAVALIDQLTVLGVPGATVMPDCAHAMASDGDDRTPERPEHEPGQGTTSESQLQAEERVAVDEATIAGQPRMPVGDGSPQALAAPEPHTERWKRVWLPPLVHILLHANMAHARYLVELALPRIFRRLPAACALIVAALRASPEPNTTVALLAVFKGALAADMVGACDSACVDCLRKCVLACQGPVRSAFLRAIFALIDAHTLRLALSDVCARMREGGDGRGCAGRIEPA